MLRLLMLLVRLEWPLRVAGPLFGRYRPFARGYREDPYPQLRKLREEAPVYFSRALGIWILSRHADVVRMLRDPNFSVARAETPIFKRMNPFEGRSPEFVGAIQRNLLMLDPPDHTRIRSLVQKAFTPRTVEKLRPRIQEIVEARLDAFAHQTEADVIREFAYPLPVIVIAELLGISPERSEDFKRWSDDLTVLLDPFQAANGLDRAESAFQGLAGYLREVFEERRASPRDDLVSSLVAAEDAGDRLSEIELLSVVGIILGAGHETTTNLIGNALVCLLRNPGERKRLQDDPGLAASAVEEFLRYETPVLATDRVATQDCEIDGRAIRRGQLCLAQLAAANRDPEVFPEPERLDLAREDNRHLAFSQGAHFCLGAALARAEAQIAIPAFLARFPDFSGDPRTVAWRRSIVLRGPDELNLRLC